MKSTGVSKPQQTQLELPWQPVPGATATVIGLCYEQKPTYQEWSNHGARLNLADRAVDWLVGDWFVWGEQQFGEEAYQALDGYMPDQIRKRVFVASRIPLARRRPSLSFTHHALVAGLKPDEQERWLSDTEKHHLTTKELAASIKHGRIVTELELNEKTPVLPQLLDIALAFKSPHWSQWKVQQWEQRQDVDEQTKQAWLRVLEEPALMYEQLKQELNGGY